SSAGPDTAGTGSEAAGSGPTADERTPGPTSGPGDAKPGSSGTVSTGADPTSPEDGPGSADTGGPLGVSGCSSCTVPPLLASHRSVRRSRLPGRHSYQSTNGDSGV